MRLERVLLPVQGLHDARRAGLTLVLAGPLVRPPAGGEPIAGLRHRVLQPSVLGLLLLVLLLPLLPLATPRLLPGVISAGVEPRLRVVGRVEVEEPVGDVAQQGPVVADDRETAVVLVEPAGQEVQAVGVEVVGRLVEQQHVVPRAEQTRQAHPIALPHRQRRQGAVAVGTGVKGLQCHVDAAFGVPRVEPGGRVERGGVAVLGARIASGQGEGRLVQRGQGGKRRGQRLGREGADRLAVAGGQLLAGQADRAGPLHGAVVRRDQPGEDVQQRRLAATVLADDRHPRPGGDGDRDVGQDATGPAGHCDVGGAHVRAAGIDGPGHGFGVRGEVQRCSAARDGAGQRLTAARREPGRRARIQQRKGAAVSGRSGPSATRYLVP